MALRDAEMVVSLSPYADANSDLATVMLPIAPFTETSGSFVNAEGRLQSFIGVVAPLGQARPAWKVLRVLGNLLGLSGFEHISSEEVRAEALGDAASIASRLSNATSVSPSLGAVPGRTLERIADVPIYMADALVRRSPPLQATADARLPVASLAAAQWEQLALRAGDMVRVTQTQGAASVVLPAVLDASLADNVVRVPAGHPSTVTLGPMFGTVTVERA
jgi:NADH-quinone oxidoreductase subunit G